MRSFFLFCSLFFVLCVGCRERVVEKTVTRGAGQQDVAMVKASNNKMNAAMDEARRTVSQFTENKEKMKQHVPLTDEDRAPWLTHLRGIITDALEHPSHTVLACSALKLAYRYQLRVDQRRVRLVYIDGKPADLAEHLKTRDHEYFSGLDMLIHQLCTFEELRSWEEAVVVERTEDWAAMEQTAQERLGI